MSTTSSVRSSRRNTATGHSDIPYFTRPQWANHRRMTMLARTNGAPKRPNPIDQQVGVRIRLRRNIIGMTQEKLAEQLGITFQQVQKYEKGTNRVGASRLQAISQALQVQPSYFFDEISTDNTGSGQVDEIMSFVQSAEGVALIRAFSAIGSANQRQKIIALVKAMASPSIDN